MNDNIWPKIIDPANGRYKIKKRVMSIVIESYPVQHAFFCPDCRNVMFFYQGDVVSMDAGSAPMKAPVEIMCSNQNCRKTIRIDYLITDYRQ